MYITYSTSRTLGLGKIPFYERLCIELFMYLSHVKIWISQKFRNFIRYFVSLLTRERKLHLINHYRKFKNIMSNSFEQRVFIGILYYMEYHKLDRNPTMARRSFQQKFNVKIFKNRKWLIIYLKSSNGQCGQWFYRRCGLQPISHYTSKYANSGRNYEVYFWKSLRRAGTEAELSNTIMYRIIWKQLKLFP